MSGLRPTCFQLTLAYDGSDFSGWQAQRGGHAQPGGCRTVQGVLEAALAEIARPVRVVGAGRTDAGVHAEGQVASVALATRLDAATLQRALNAKLPHDVVVREVALRAPGFHARRDARAKVYRYDVWNGPERSPLRARRALHVREPLDLAALEEAARHLLGTHDFASFQAAGSAVVGTVRTLQRLTLAGVAGHLVSFELQGDGFLRHMVRNAVGTLLEVGRGRRPPGAMPEVLAARDRAAAGPTAAAHGLTLVRVLYGA